MRAGSTARIGMQITLFGSSCLRRRARCRSPGVGGERDGQTKQPKEAYADQGAPCVRAHTGSLAPRARSPRGRLARPTLPRVLSGRRYTLVMEGDVWLNVNTSNKLRPGQTIRIVCLKSLRVLQLAKIKTVYFYYSSSKSRQF